MSNTALYVGILVIFISSVISIRGNTWDHSKSGYRQVTIAGWIAVLMAVFGLIVTSITTYTSQKESHDLHKNFENALHVIHGLQDANLTTHENFFNNIVHYTTSRTQIDRYVDTNYFRINYHEPYEITVGGIKIRALVSISSDMFNAMVAANGDEELAKKLEDHIRPTNTGFLESYDSLFDWFGNFLNRRGYELVHIADNSQRMWIRDLWEAKSASQFAFYVLYESESNASGSQAYIKITLADKVS
jgi:hypothetical protein